MPKTRVLIVDDEELLRTSIVRRLSGEGLDVTESGTSAKAEALLEESDFDVAIVDLRLPDGDGMELSRKILSRSPLTMVIVLTAYSSVDGAVQAIKDGAYDYLTKPVPLDKLVLTVRRAVETAHLRHEVDDVRRDLKTRFGLSTIVAVAPTMKRVIELAAEVARSDARTILIRGESGSGKTLLGRAIHTESARQERPFVQITCSTLQETLLESELFGHERGSFTDAKSLKRGLFEIADDGTVFLDEISEMSERLQAKVLQVLDDHVFRRIGGLQNVRVNVRIIAATHQNLEALVRARRFREDLYYRLNVIPIFLPPLRERKEDIPELAGRFIEHYCREFRKPRRELSPQALEILKAHSWPGNVRELKNVIERAVLLSGGSVLEPADLVIGAPLQEERRSPFRLPAEGVVLEELEKDFIAQALARTGGSLVKTAKLLGVTKDTLRYRIKKFSLDVGARSS
ncbi:MAG: sigma-54-dependent Fis family transcriptional regulator [Planctomycetes bacterium]|nr:sigma-54-dependent Fis family transcriptional regulator [Planctomycetota bacterium]